MNTPHHDATRQHYVADVLLYYTLLPNTPDRPSRNDRRVATQLFTHHVPIDKIKTAFLLAISRRSFRPPDAPPLEPIRTLAYFLPVVSEVQRANLDPLYIDLLKHRLETAFPDLRLPPLETPISS